MHDSLLADRLEMLLVAQWLDEGSPGDGMLGFAVADAAAELGCADGRAGILEIMGALGILEEVRRVRVEWSGIPGAHARVQLSDELCRDAQRVFQPPATG
jgi:hypothetical protein